jgi:hypothetical protein
VTSDRFLVLEERKSKTKTRINTGLFADKSKKPALPIDKAGERFV